VKDLPQILADYGVTIDSSTLCGHSNRINAQSTGVEQRSRLQRMARLCHTVTHPLPRPYRAAAHDVEVKGSSRVLEIPIWHNILDLASLPHGMSFALNLFRSRFHRSTTYVMLFFHIDEITVSGEVPDDRTAYDGAAIGRMERVLAGLQSIRGAEFVSISEAARIYEEERSCGHGAGARERVPL
jgi:hypothetical protein